MLSESPALSPRWPEEPLAAAGMPCSGRPPISEQQTPEEEEHEDTRLHTELELSSTRKKKTHRNFMRYPLSPLLSAHAMINHNEPSHIVLGDLKNEERGGELNANTERVRGSKEKREG